MARVTSAVTAYIAHRILEHMAEQTNHAASGKAVRALGNALSNSRESRDSALRALYLVGAIRKSEQGRAQWFVMTPLGHTILEHYRKKPPALPKKR